MDKLDNSSVYSSNTSEQSNSFNNLMLEWLAAVRDEQIESALYTAVQQKHYYTAQCLLTEHNAKITDQLKPLVSGSLSTDMLRLLVEHAIIQEKKEIAHLIYEKIIQQKFYQAVEGQKFPQVAKALTQHNAKITHEVASLVSEKTPINILELLWNHANLQGETEIALLIREKAVQKHFYCAVKTENISDVHKLLTQHNAKITDQLESLVSGSLSTDMLRLLVEHAIIQGNRENAELIYLKLINKEAIEGNGLTNIHSDLVIKLFKSFEDDIQIMPSFIKLHYYDDYIKALRLAYCKDLCHSFRNESEKAALETQRATYLRFANNLQSLAKPHTAFSKNNASFSTNTHQLSLRA